MKKYSLRIFVFAALATSTTHGCSLSFFSSVTEFDPQVPSTPRTGQQIYIAPVQIVLMTGLHALPHAPASSSPR